MTASVALNSDRTAVAVREDVAIGGRNVGAKIIDTFDVLAEAAGGVAEVRRVILTLGMQGRLTGQRRMGDVSARSIEDAPFDIPASWRWARLEEVATYNAGERMSADSIPAEAWLLDLEDIEKATSRLLNRMRARDRRSKSTKSSFCRGDVLYGKLRPYLDKVLVADEDGFCTTEIAPVRAGPDMDSQFLRYALKRPDFLMYVSGRTYGINLPRLSSADARAALVPVPPLAEQKHIVAKIDQLMALCDELEVRQAKRRAVRALVIKSTFDALIPSEELGRSGSAWKRVSENLDLLTGVPEGIQDLRRAILGLAVRGRLVPQNSSDEPAENLVRRITHRRSGTPSTGGTPADGPFRLPPGWAWASLPQLGEFGRGKSKHRPRNDPTLFTGGKYPLVQTGDVARSKESYPRTPACMEMLGSNRAASGLGVRCASPLPQTSPTLESWTSMLASPTAWWASFQTRKSGTHVTSSTSFARRRRTSSPSRPRLPRRTSTLRSSPLFECQYRRRLRWRASSQGWRRC